MTKELFINCHPGLYDRPNSAPINVTNTQTKTVDNSLTVNLALTINIKGDVSDVQKKSIIK